MIETFTAASRLPQTDRDQAAAIGEAEGAATVALLRQLRDGDWQRPTDCTEWDVRSMVSHLVGQCEDGIGLRTMMRRELVGKRRYPDKTGVDAHMAVQVDDHHFESGPDLVERFALLQPRAVQARRRRPGLMRHTRVNTGIPSMPRFTIGYLLDIIYNRDLWMHRIDLGRATGQTVVTGNHERRVVEQVIRDLALGWTGPPVALELTGLCGGSWQIGPGEPVAHIRADAVAYMRTVAGRDDDPSLELVSGDESCLASVQKAHVAF